MKKKQLPPDKLSRWAAAAKAEGLSYGYWAAKHHPPGTPWEEDPYCSGSRTYFVKTCPHCGKVFRTTAANKIYCDPVCTAAARSYRKYLHKLARKTEKEETCSTKS